MFKVLIKYTFLIIEIIFSIMFLTSLSFASPTSVTNGLNWLSANQNPDSSWGSNVDLQILDTSTVLDTLKYLNVSSPAYSNGVTWLGSQYPSPTDFVSRKIVSLYMAGVDVSADLSTLVDSRNSDGGWGGDADSTSMINDTVLALQALNAINYFDQRVILLAINYLLSTQNPDGGFGFYSGDVSNVYMTALVSTTLQQFPKTTSLATAINKATSYLITHQNTDGGFGSSPSTVFETALAYIALVGVITDNTVLGNAVNYLTATQFPNGSWNDDPYSTALALRALYLSENKPVPPSPPTTGTVTGKVVDASTNQPLGGVTVVSGQLSATTTNTGEFTLSDIPLGSQTITFPRNDYATATNFLDIRNNLATMVLYNYCLGGINVS